MSGKRVYFLRPVGQLGPIKIGCSKLPELRLETLTVWSPTRLELICSVPGSHKEERTLHGMFQKHHVHGEWFGASKELLALIDHCQAMGELPALPEVVKFPRVRHVGHKGRAAGKKEPGELSPEKLELARVMRGQYESGLSTTAIALEHGKAPPTVCRYIRAAGGTITYQSAIKHAGVADKERAEEFKRRYLAGDTLKQIGDDYGVTRERVRQILRKTGVESLGHRPEHCTQRRDLTETEIEAARLYDAGTCPKEIIARTGLDPSQIARAVRRCGFKIKGRSYWLTRPDDAEITRSVCDLYLKGFSAPQIVKRVEQIKYPETVYRYLKKGGVKPRNPHMGNYRFRRQSSAA